MGRAGVLRASLVALTILLCAPPAIAAPAGISNTPALANTPSHVKQIDDIEVGLPYLISYLDDSQELVTSPVRWDREDWRTFGIVAGGTLALYIADGEIRDFMQSNRSGGLDSAERFLDRVGNYEYTLPALAAFYGYGVLAKDRRAESTALLCVESVVLTAAMTEALKYTTGRRRPYHNTDNTRFIGPLDSDTGEGLYESFPSGHASHAFAIATVIADQYEDRPVVPLAAYGVATLVAVSRLYGDHHWASDVLVGAALGHYTSKALLSYHAKGEGLKAAVLPYYDGQSRGVMLTVAF